VSAYVEIAPPPALRPFVEWLWIHRIDGPPPADGRRLLPSGRADLVWIAGLGARVSGPLSRYSRPLELPPMLVFGARFHPGAAPYLLRTPAAELVDRHVPLDAIDPRLARGLDDRLGAARDAGEALAALGAELERRLRTAAPPPPAVREAVRLLDGGTATVAETAARTFVSERALQRRFAHEVGYGPKLLQRVLRFQRFMRELAVPRVELARAALLAGYADQAHLSRETRRLAGLSPRQLMHWQH
jgi:AraC-like DNA-binding protein